MRYLLDTSALLAHVRGEVGAEEVQKLFEDDDAVILLCSISIAELARRFRSLGASEEEARDRVNGYLQAVDEVVVIDEMVAWDSERIGCAATNRLPLVDALIAATARSRKAVLVHRDSHMRSIPVEELPQVDLSSAK